MLEKGKSGFDAEKGKARANGRGLARQDRRTRVRGSEAIRKADSPFLSSSDLLHKDEREVQRDEGLTRVIQSLLGQELS